MEAIQTLQLMPVHRTNVAIQSFNQPKFEVELPVETVETEIIESRRENKRLPLLKLIPKKSLYSI